MSENDNQQAHNDNQQTQNKNPDAEQDAIDNDLVANVDDLIHMDGTQSFPLNAINRAIQEGRNITHILNLKVSNQPNEAVGNRLRQAIFQHINNNPITKMVNGTTVIITWKSENVATSAYYYANIQLFTDVAVQEHTKQLFADLLEQLDEQFGHIFSTRETGLAFLVTKPTTQQILYQ
ncbi:hypothetical protein SeLEV6574_g03515 [Synchytrium endobioticum]|uniref:Uncharacterized protein n=1 Tax=Synchytrium endobioticum TaxID=286115 RepID=A0A507D3C4_9FUNG|nr:hypothetical protein SeLEV6574_g03515 [Synchytrium endobioticum]